MQESLLAVLCAEAQEGALLYSRHYAQRLLERPMPDRSAILYMLCEDDPVQLEENEPTYPGGSQSSLIWGILQDGRVGHVLCSHPPDPVVITAYWPDTEPGEWVDNYRRRVQQ